MTPKEQLGLYMAAYKEAAVKVARSFGPPQAVPHETPVNMNPVQGEDYQMVMDTGVPSAPDNYTTPVPVPGISYRRVGPSEPAYTPSEAYQYSPVDYARQALAQVYGQNHLNSLSDDAYVMRKWRAAMQGNRRAALMDAYRKAYLGHNGMLASQGAAYGGDKAKNYGIWGLYKTPDRPRQMTAGNPYQISTPGQGPRFQSNKAGELTEGQYNTIQYWRNFQNQRSAAFRNQANQQARKMNGVPPARQQTAQPPKPQSTTTGAIPDDLRKEVIGSLGNNSMTA